LSWESVSPVELSVALVTICIVVCATTASRASQLRGIETGTAIILLYAPLLGLAFLAFGLGVFGEATVLAHGLRVVTQEAGANARSVPDLVTGHGSLVFMSVGRWLALPSLGFAIMFTVAIQKRLQLVS